MRIVLRGGTRDLVLCDGDESGIDKSRGPNGFSVTRQSASELAPGIRSKGVLPLSRANASYTIAFEVTRECASHGAAIAWALTHSAALDALDAAVAVDQPTKKMSLTLQGSGYDKTITPVVMGPISVPRFIGVSVIINYQFVAGAMP
jgi:hypothetical protein